jgi:hypothetical protein
MTAKLEKKGAKATQAFLKFCLELWSFSWDFPPPLFALYL